MNEAAWKKSTPKGGIVNQLWQAIINMNEKLDKLANITQNLEIKLNGTQKEMIEQENKLNPLEKEKMQLRNEMIQKT